MCGCVHAERLALAMGIMVLEGEESNSLERDHMQLCDLQQSFTTERATFTEGVRLLNSITLG